jgi:hypothetical protein
MENKEQTKTKKSTTPKKRKQDTQIDISKLPSMSSNKQKNY